MPILPPMISGMAGPDCDERAATGCGHLSCAISSPSTIARSSSIQRRARPDELVYRWALPQKFDCVICCYCAGG